MTAHYEITRCPGCSTCKRPASRSVADLTSDSAPGERRERGVPGRRPSEVPVRAGRNSLTSRRGHPSAPAATHPVPTSRGGGLDPFPNAATSGIPNPGG